MFDAVTLNYNGKEYTVPAEKTWGLIAVIEHKTDGLYALSKMLENKIYKRTLIVDAYHAALQYAGCKADIAEVNKAMAMADVFSHTATLMGILMLAEPPSDVDLGSSDQPGVAYNDGTKLGKSAKTGKASKPSTAG